VVDATLQPMPLWYGYPFADGGELLANRDKD
jgi:hypothetical protein